MRKGHRLPGPRWPSGPRMLKDRCPCGKAKCVVSQQCRACADLAKRTPSSREAARAALLARSPAVSRGYAAYRVAHPPTMSVCVACEKTFSRGAARRPKHDVLRFCSKQCAARFNAAKTLPERDKLRRAREAEYAELHHAREITRELTRAQRLYARSICACGAAIARVHGRLCEVCYRASHGKKRFRNAVSHVCPNCGRGFHAAEDVVYCSRRCRHQYAHKGRYPALGSLPLDLRNQIAALVALVRSAQRLIHGESARSGEIGETGEVLQGA